MSVFGQIMSELEELYLVENVTNQHDEARIQFRPHKNTVQSDWEFDNIIGDYYNHHLAGCNEGTFSKVSATEKAKDIVFGAYIKKGKDKFDAYYDAQKGTNGGLRTILDIIMDFLKEEALRHHVRSVLDSYVSPTDYDEKLDLVTEILYKVDSNARDIDRNRPERYVHDYEKLVHLFMETRNVQAAKLRRF